MRRIWRGNGEVAPTVLLGPDEYSVELQQGLTVLTHPASPRNQGTATHKHVGLLGYGLNGNRFAGLTGPLQDFRGAARAVQQPARANVGIGAGVSGQPGLPGTALPGIDNSLAMMSLGQLGQL